MPSPVNPHKTAPTQAKQQFMPREMFTLDVMVCAADEMSGTWHGIENILMRRMRRGVEGNWKAAFFMGFRHERILQLLFRIAPFHFQFAGAKLVAMIFRAQSILIFVAMGASAFAADALHFSRDVLPLLSDNCLACHGHDEKQRKGGLRLDTREGATAVKDGTAAVVPGRPKDSELLARVVSDDPDEAMPPPKSHKKKLSAGQVAMLTRWIEAGAPWGKHWAFERPEKAPLPPGPVHPVDAFVASRLAEEELSIAKEAARHTLARRAAFDLTGLPPNAEALAAYEKDTKPGAFERYVDTLFASPHFGERMAMWWLDAARYSDTDGFQADATRTNWPWRDYLIVSFNANKRFDQFTIEQFAGDLLPNATPEQKLATCFHRNHMTNGEGGRDPEESRIDYVLDRVNTTGTVWLGLTLNCCQCHSHKFDPITQSEYYQLFAFFDSIDEDGKAGGGAKPYLAYESPFAVRSVEEAQQLVETRKPAEAAARKAAEGPFEKWLADRAGEVRGGFAAWRVLEPVALESIEGTELSLMDDGSIVARGANPKQDDYRVFAPVKLPRITGLKLEVLPDAAHTGGKFSRGKSGEFILTDIKVQVRRRSSSQIRDILVGDAVADYPPPVKEKREYGDIKGVLDDDPRNGWTTAGAPKIGPHVGVFALAEPLVLDADEELVFELKQRSTNGDANIGRFRISATDQAGTAVHSVEPAPLEQLAQSGIGDIAKMDAKLRGKLFEQFLADFGSYQIEKSALDRAIRQLTEVQAAAKKLNVMVLAERKEPRDTHLLVRGVWDKKGEKVERGVPTSVGALPLGEDRSRLGLARWIVSRENPLTARVMVNNLWAMLFGAGIVRTPEDFGLQGERPTHPELLDWLAVEFMESGWDVRHILKLMVTSATYRQDSATSEALLARDPENRLFARGARFRLPAWMLRDAALANSGLLNSALGGPPVRPYQPDGVWEEIFMGRFKYEPSEGAAQYRRTLYAFWRRSIAPTFLFDSAQRRVCEVRTQRTNTPLHALTLLNDRTMLEASHTLAGQALSASGDTDGRLRTIFLRVLSRAPEPRELTVLRRELDRALDRYRANPADAAKFLASVGAPADSSQQPPELAAYTVVASLVQNLDEAITHE